MSPSVLGSLCDVGLSHVVSCGVQQGKLTAEGGRALGRLGCKSPLCFRLSFLGTSESAAGSTLLGCTGVLGDAEPRRCCRTLGWV